ncbi:MAG: lysozyme [Actinobacteria bacterium]|nr:lysozyme [Actinomycetota bacterium]
MKMREKTDLIVVHCAATPSNMDIGADEIRRWHKEKGWLDIGYHYVIRRNGKIEEGRHVLAQGAHVRGYNDHSVGICLVGGVDANNKRKAKDNFTVDQWISLGWLLAAMHGMFPDAKIVGHRDLDPHKACPSFDVKERLAGILRLV